MSSVIRPAAVVIIGVGGMGQAIARRIAAGRTLILVDYSEHGLESASEQLQRDGHIVQTHKVDVSDFTSVKRLAADAANAGRIEAVIHTAGLSPAMASSDRIFEVDLLGTAIVIDAFADVIVPRGSLICIASMAGHSLHGKLAMEVEEHLAEAPIDSLLSLTGLKLWGDQSTSHAYSLSKRGNQLRVQAAARRYGMKGIRINSISPGVVHTPMVELAMTTAHGEAMRAEVEDSAARRYGTASDIAAVVAFLISPEASFITGTDILVDGGSTANQRWRGGTGSVQVYSWSEGTPYKVE